MKTIILLSGEDRKRLQQLLRHEAPPPWPSPDATRSIQAFLKRARPSDESSELEVRVGIGDRVKLVSPLDSRDVFDLTVVMPHEADPDEDRISVGMPVSLAVLGRRAGERAMWETPAGHREMTIVSVLKPQAAETAR